MFQEIRGQGSVPGSEGRSSSPNPVDLKLSSIQSEHLEHRRSCEHEFAHLLKAHGFAQVQLPHLMPMRSFRSQLTGESLLPQGPSFRDPSGMDWALRSDMTAFSAQFVRNVGPGADFPMRIGYSGSVFSYGPQGAVVAPEGHGLRHPHLESFEFGAEVVDAPGARHEAETLVLAIAAAQKFGYERLVVCLGHTDIWRAVVEWAPAQGRDKDRLQEAMRAGDLAFLSQQGDLLEVINAARKACGIEALITDTEQALANETSVSSAQSALPCRSTQGAPTEVGKSNCEVSFRVDALLVRPHHFYSGFVFELFAEGVDATGGVRLVRVGAGGRYDDLLKHYSLNLSASGFKICDPSVIFAELRGACDFGAQRAHLAQAKARIRIAVPKGRLLSDLLRAFGDLGIVPDQNPEESRKLVIPSRCGRYEFLLVKNSDVPTYVERNVADVGVVGSDVLDESITSVTRPVTFTFGKTNICLAGVPGTTLSPGVRKKHVVASKYLKIAARELGKRGYDCDLIPLSGSVELASVLGMADAIVDLVQTGKTLADNGLTVLEELSETRVHLVVSKAFLCRNQELLDDWQSRWQASGLVQAARLSREFFRREEFPLKRESQEDVQ